MCINEQQLTTKAIQTIGEFEIRVMFCLQMVHQVGAPNILIWPLFILISSLLLLKVSLRYRPRCIDTARVSREAPCETTLTNVKSRQHDTQWFVLTTFQQLSVTSSKQLAVAS